MKELETFRKFLAEGKDSRNIIQVLKDEIEIIKREGEDPKQIPHYMEAIETIDGAIEKLSIEIEKITGDDAGSTKSALMGYEFPN